MMKKNIKACCILLAISLKAMGVQAQKIITDTLPEVRKDSVINVAFGQVAKRDVLGAVTAVNVADLMNKSYGTNALDNLQSFVGGYTGNIWGQAPQILIDGIPRRIQDVRMVEVASITVLKDASSVALLGGGGSKGAILIQTRRGSIKPLTIDARANTGVFVPKRYPGYLGAADYMTLFNEALTNDGSLATGRRFRQGEIDSTRAGIYSYKYPDLNLFSSDYLRKASFRSDLTTEISGGSERARYYSNIGMSYNNNILKWGDAANNNDLNLNIRTNVDMTLTKWLKASTDAVAVINNNYAARGDFWGTTATLRPNNDGYLPLIPIDRLDMSRPDFQQIVKNSNNIIDGQYLLGGLTNMQTTQLSQMLASGYIKNRSRAFMFNVGAEADLAGITKGLSFSARYSMDYTTRYTEAFNEPYATYEPLRWRQENGRDIIDSLRQYGVDQRSTSESIGTSLYNQTVSFTSQLNYNRSFDQKHNVTAALIGWGYMTQISSDPDTDGGSDYHPIRNTNLGVQAGYNYRYKYYFDFSGAVIHSGKLPVNHRRAFSPTATVGWRLSEERFFKDNVSFVDDLKFTASFASLKQDLDITSTTDYYLYEGYYSNNSTLGRWYQWRDGVAGGWTVLSGRGSNPNLNFVERKEVRVGLDASLFQRLITVNANYFKQNTNGLLARGSATVYPSYYAAPNMGSFLPFINFNNDMRTGVDFAVNVNNNIGQLQYSLGFVGMVYNSKATRRDEVFADNHLYRVGKPLDAFWGYIAEGLFQDQAEIDGHARQTFGGGTIKPGDIKYRDINGDGIVDTRDQVDLGRNGWAANPFNYGVNLTLKWKSVTLFAVGSGQSGAIGFKNNSYYWVRGLNKYSDAVWDRWTPETAATATYPRLTTTGLNNNVQNSTYWMFKNNRFNLNRVQLTYDFNNELFKKSSFVHGMSVYVNGDNLLVISKERQMMETNFGSAPQTRFYNLGVRASF